MTAQNLSNTHIKTYLWHLKAAAIDPTHVAEYMAAHGHAPVSDISPDEMSERLKWVKRKAADIFCWTRSKAYTQWKAAKQEGGDR